MGLPLNLPLSTMQTRWKSDLDPIIGNPMNNVSILKDVELMNGVNVINHLLGRIMQGWFLVDIQGASTIYRSSPFNDLTLTLTSNASVTVSIGVF